MKGFIGDLFERYVNFEFYKTEIDGNTQGLEFERYVNFEFYKTEREEDYQATCLRDM